MPGSGPMQIQAEARVALEALPESAVVVALEAAVGPRRVGRRTPLARDLLDPSLAVLLYVCKRLPP
jgi:hypothetical protein